MVAESRPPEDGALRCLIPSVWLIAPTLALLGGQALGTVSLPLAAAALIAASLPFLLLARWRREALLVVLAAVAFSIGYLRHRQLLHPHFSAAHLRSVAAAEGRLYLEGTLRQEPERVNHRTRWQVRAERVWHATGAQKVHGDLLLTVRAARRDWHFGDRVRFWIRPTMPQNSGNPAGFEYATYLARRGVYVTGFLENDAEVELLARSPPPVRGFIEGLRRQIRRFVERNFAPENAALLSALVVGETGGITREQRAAFTAAGLSHLLAISGLHIGMLGLAAFALARTLCSLNSELALRWNIVKVAAVVSFLFVVFYAALAGAKVPTLRAAIMIGVYQLAVLLDREEEVFASMTLAALIIALIWPGAVAEISFQLSFLAVLFIVWGLRKLHRWFPPPRKDGLPQEMSGARQWLRASGFYLAVPLLATLGTGPIIAHHFGYLSLAGFLANPLVVPLVGFVVVPLGLIIALLALAAPATAAWLAWLAEYPVAVAAGLVNAFAQIPQAKIAVPTPDLTEVALLYGLLLSILALKKGWPMAAALAVISLLCTWNAAYWWRERYRRSELRVAHLNVGLGDAAVVELPGAKVLLIDAGGTAADEFDTGESIIAPYLRSRKILKVDYVAVSHARIDHYGGMRAVVEQFSPAEFWSAGGRGKTRRFDDLEEAVEKGGLARVALSASEPCRTIDGVQFCALYPPENDGADLPAVLRLEFDRLRYLFSSDVDRRDEAKLLGHSPALRAAVMTVPRHGSATASTREFLAAVAPKLAVLSGGGRGRAGTKRDEVVERYLQAGAEVLTTRDDGAIIVESDGHTLRYRGHKSGKGGEIKLEENIH